MTNLNSPWRASVLVVDGQHSVADTLSQLLRKSGFLATAQYSTAAALSLARGLRFDFLIIEVMMSQPNGIEAAIRMQSIHPDCRVLLLSGHMDAGDLLDISARRGHEFEILPKPAPPQAILRFLGASAMPVNGDRHSSLGQSFLPNVAPAD